MWSSLILDLKKIFRIDLFLIMSMTSKGRYLFLVHRHYLYCGSLSDAHLIHITEDMFHCFKSGNLFSENLFVGGIFRWDFFVTNECVECFEKKILKILKECWMWFALKFGISSNIVGGRAKIMFAKLYHIFKSIPNWIECAVSKMCNVHLNLKVLLNEMRWLNFYGYYSLVSFKSLRRRELKQ